LNLAVSHTSVYTQIIILVQGKFGFDIIQLARSSREQRLWRVTVSNWAGCGRGRLGAEGCGGGVAK